MTGRCDLPGLAGQSPGCPGHEHGNGERRMCQVQAVVMAVVPPEMPDFADSLVILWIF